MYMSMYREEWYGPSRLVQQPGEKLLPGLCQPAVTSKRLKKYGSLRLMLALMQSGTQHMKRTIGASIITYTILGVPCYNCSIRRPQALF